METETRRTLRETDADKGLAAVNNTARTIPIDEDDEDEIDLGALFYRFLEKAHWIILCALIGAAIAGVLVFKVIKPIYQATAKIYIVGSDTTISLTDLQIGSNLAADYREVFKNWHVHELVDKRLNLDYSYTKLNNMLIDETSGRGCCVIDLDTTMPGLPHYDFGDMLRTGTSPAAEDERDLTKVCMRFEMYEALLRGFLSTAGNFLTPAEKAMLPHSGMLLTLETGIRFLTDYLEGDVYFKTARPGHNLDRCRTQIKLVESMENQLDAMRRLCDDLAKR